MPSTSPVVHRSQKSKKKRLQPGTVVSYTTLMHPPSPFPHRPRTIGLIELADGSRVFGELIGTPAIGASVAPRMRLSHVNEEKLRVYDVAYEVTADVRELTPHAFPGYIVALTGPTGVGKTTVGQLFISMMKGYAAHVPMVTTLPRAKHENPDVRHLSRRIFADLMRKGEIVAATRHPSDTDEWYGYRKSDIDAVWEKRILPVVITDIHLLQGLSDAFGRRSILSFGLLPPGKSKRTRVSHLVRRLRQAGHAAEKRKVLMQRAEKELTTVQSSRLLDHLLVNEDVDAVLATLRKHTPGLA